MIKKTFVCIVTFGLLMGGCVKIPDRHGTVGTYSGPGDMTTECFGNGSLLPYNDSASLQRSEVLNSQRFRVLNWNSYKGSGQKWQEDLERLSRQSDLVALQEGYLTDDLQDLFSKRQYSWDIAKAFAYNDIYAGVLTASRVRPDFLCSFRVPEPLTGIPKTVLVTRYPLSGTSESLVLANIHMINLSLNISAYRAQLEKTAEVLAEHQGPLIICGDFNSWSTERVRILNNIMQQIGVKAVLFETDLRATFMGMKIDHIYYRKLEPLEMFSEKVETSDHNPMHVTFRLADDR